jgi:enoyl-CoA hydratase/carnithine racemase
MSFKTIHYQKDEGVALITLNRPERLNAITQPMVMEWAQALEDARLDSEVRAVVVTGAGRGFCSGADMGGGLGLSETTESEALPTAAEQRNWLRDGIHYVPRAVQLLDKPYIAAINGVTVGAGMDMASMCDIRFASDRARFSMGFVRVGILPGDGGCYFLPRIVGIAKALELIWTGDFIDAAEAEQIGYVTRPVAHDELLPTTLAFARRLAQGPPIAIQLAKRLVYQGLHATLPEALEQTSLAMGVVLGSHDAREGLKAMMEKREPRFAGQ